jgi:ubiquinone/menaquinone biosynthesis C-methylase UbiE
VSLEKMKNDPKRNLEATRAYYDEFAKGYENERRPNAPRGYHAMIDDLEIAITSRYATGKDLLGCGCGTGLLLEKMSAFTNRAVGVDLSPGMLEAARARGLEVSEGSVTKLPFDDASFDVTCSFKVLAHVPEIALALSEMARVTKPGGWIVAEFYNPISWRGLVKRLGRPGKISSATRESAVYTRFDAPWVIPRIIPPGTKFDRAFGVRIVTPAAAAMRIPIVRSILRRAEHALSPTKMAFFAGFYVAVLRRV